MLARLALPAAAPFFGLVFVVTLLCASRMPISSDAEMSFRAAQLWLETGSMALQPGDFESYALRPSPDGKRYSKYPLLAFLNCVPAAQLVRHFGDVPLPIGLLALALVPAAWTALLALALALWLARLGFAPRRALGLTALVVVSTPLAIYARGYYGEMSQAALLLWALLLAHTALEDARWALWAGVLVGLCVGSKATFLVLVPCVALALPREGWLRFALGVLPGACLVAAYNYARYQNVFEFGYGSERDGTLGFGTPLWVGLFGNLLSPGKSLFLYAPLLALAPFGMQGLVQRQRRFWLLAWAAPSLALTLIVSTWWAWSGDMAWGPRLLVPIMPWLALPALLASTRGPAAWRAALALGALGVLVQLPALLLSEYEASNHVWRITRPALSMLASKPLDVADDGVLLHYVPWLSPVLAQGWLLLAKLFGAASVGKPPWMGDGFDRLSALPRLPAWNLWLDDSPLALLLLALLLLAAGGLLLRVLRATEGSRS